MIIATIIALALIAVGGLIVFFGLKVYLGGEE